MFGRGPAGPPVSASCAVNPSEVMVGEPATATAAGSNFNPRHTLNYTWTSTGGEITGKDNTASIDTNGVAGGTYTVTAHISDPKMKQGGEASCMAAFTVKEPPKNPPAVSCSAIRRTVQAGASSSHQLHLHQSGQCPSYGRRLDRERRAAFPAAAAALRLSIRRAFRRPITVSAICTDSRGLNTRLPPR